jgi:hypothetical protein
MTPKSTASQVATVVRVIVTGCRRWYCRDFARSVLTTLKARPGDGLAFLAHGLARIQWGGPWTAEGANPRWAGTHTHWVAGKWWQGDEWIFDVNGGWTFRSTWEAEIIPAITATIKRADGTWFPTHRWEVRKP